MKVDIRLDPSFAQPTEQKQLWPRNVIVVLDPRVDCVAAWVCLAIWIGFFVCCSGLTG